MKKIAIILEKNVKIIEPYLYMNKFSYFHSQVAIYEKSCPLQLILVCKIVAKDTISQNIVPLLKFKYCLSK